MRAIPVIGRRSTLKKETTVNSIKIKNISTSTKVFSFPSAFHLSSTSSLQCQASVSVLTAFQNVSLSATHSMSTLNRGQNSAVWAPGQHKNTIPHFSAKQNSTYPAGYMKANLNFLGN